VAKKEKKMSNDKHVVIVGGGFVGLNCAKELGNASGIRVTVLDRRNHHLFQPLLYQVAMAGLSPAEIAAPIRSLLSEFPNIETLQTVVTGFDLEKRRVLCDAGDVEYDFLVVGAGAKHSYFGNERWEEFAPGLKTLSQATEIRSRVLVAFENAETCRDAALQSQFLTFVVVGGGPTGVELAGALGEMARFTLTKEFRHIDFGKVRILLVEGAPRLLAAFTPAHSAKAAKVLEGLGVQVRLGVHVTDITADGISIGAEFIAAKTVLWAAGVHASSLAAKLGGALDKAGRLAVEPDLSIPGHPEVFAAGDMAQVKKKDGTPVPGMAPAALQEGKYLGRLIKGELRGVPRKPFRYLDKGQMATIGRSQAVLESGWLQLSGFPAWLAWVVIHIFYLTGLRNRVFVVFSWAWSWFNFNTGARLIVRKEWRFWGPSA
jgi:NADH:ubiquinone reductase (H+-translocating)